MTRYLRHAVTFEGRASRSEFWWATAASSAVAFVLLVVPLGQLLLLALVVPTVALTARRLHDVGRSGWWQLAFYVSWIPLLAACIPGFVAARRLDGQWETLDSEPDPYAYLDRLVAIGGTSVVVSLVLIGVAGLLAILSFCLWSIWMARGPQHRGDRFGPSGILIG